MTANSLMAVKVLILIAAIAAFAWWQFRDLAQEKKRRLRQDDKADSEQK